LVDASRYATRFAGEMNGFDPLEWLDKKDIKKCGRFIQLALAGTSMAITPSGLQVHAGNATRVGVTVGSGIGGFEAIEREHQVLLERGPANNCSCLRRYSFFK
jgi:3-oxoacyl-[acyl-carrier-protein] synthase II